MARTYRSKRYRQNWGGSFDWILREYVNDPANVPFDDITRVEMHSWGWYLSYAIWYNKDSKEGKKRLSYYYSDNGTYKHKEPGPSWFRNLYVERPQRRHAKNELRKFMLDPEYEVILNAKDHLVYWT